jgi:hypothetical protein
MRKVIPITMGVLLLGGIVLYGAWIAVTGVPGLEEAQQQTLAEARAQTRPTETVESAAADKTPEPSPEPQRIARTVPQVLHTTFVPEYRRNQTAIAGPQWRNTYHPDVDLAADGLDICRMIGDDRVTLTDMIEDFTNNDHPHKGPVTPKAAMQTYRLALRTLCPDLTPEFEEKQP